MEIKTPGDKLSEDQVAFGKSILAKGGIYFVCRKYSDWEILSEIIGGLGEERRYSKTDRTEKEIREYAEGKCEEILAKEKDWREYSESRAKANNEKRKLKKKLLAAKRKAEIASGKFPERREENIQRPEV